MSKLTRKILDFTMMDKGAAVSVQFGFHGQTWNRAYRIDERLTHEQFERQVAEDARRYVAFEPIIARLGKVKEIKYDDGVKRKPTTDGKPT